MRFGLLLATVFVLGPGLSALAEEGPHWETNLDSAKRVAAQTNRLVLVHLWAPYCGPCKKLDANVFSQPGVGQAIEARFVPVKINVEEWPATSRSIFEVDHIPVDAIMTPQGKILCKLDCPQDPRQYLVQLSQAADRVSGIATAPPKGQVPIVQAPTVPIMSNANPYRPAANAGLPGGQRAPGAGSAVASDMNNGGANASGGGGSPSIYSQNNNAAYVPRDPAAAQAFGGGPPTVSQVAVNAPEINPPVIPGPNVNQPFVNQPNVNQPTGNPFGASPGIRTAPGSPMVAVGGGTGPSAQPPRMPAAAQPPAGPAPLGLDGFCPVTLIERSRTAPDDPHCWIRGDPRWGAVHRGITYLFNSPEEQKRFLANPDRYAPALSGNDAVLAFDRGRLERGRREFGTFCESRIYLFASKETLEAFQKDPQRYVDEVRQAENPPHAAVR